MLIALLSERGKEMNRPKAQKLLRELACLAVKISYGIGQVFAAYSMGPGGNAAQKIYERELELLKKLE